MYRFLFKRTFDFIASIIGFVIITPLFLFLWVWLSIANKGAGALFFQERSGKNEKIFRMIKFKTMNDRYDASGKLLPDDQRLTRVGKFVRSTSMDEIPQLLNVIKGDMSIIGPRPLYVRYLPYYTKEEHHRHEVRPGITGLAQVSGRKNITWTNKLLYDIEYVNKCTFWLDVNIIWLTIVNVIKRDNVGVDTSGTNDFNDYREREWAAEGRHDLIVKARAEVAKLKK